MRNQVNPQTFRIVQPVAKIALLIAAFTTFSLIYYYNFRKFPLLSDEANVFLEGYDISKGNWFLKGWSVAEDNYLTTDSVFYAALIKFVGFNPHIMFYLPAMIWAGLAFLSVTLAWRGMAGGNKAVAAALLTPIFFPITWQNGYLYMIAHAPAHVATIVYVLLCFLLAAKIISGQSTDRRLALASYTLILALVVFGDPLSLFVGVIPIIAVAVFSIFYGGGFGQKRSLLGASILAVIIAKVLLFFNSHVGGFDAYHFPIRFVSFGDLGRNVALILHYFFTLFGCDFFGKDVLASPVAGPMLPLIRLPFLALLIFALVLVGMRLFKSLKAVDREWPRHERDYLDALLAVGLAIDVLAAAFSTQIANATTIRYLFPALVFGTILIARIPIVTRWLAPYAFLALTASLIFFLVNCWQEPRRALFASKEVETVSNWLCKNGMKDGYGPYWSSSIITALTTNRLRVRPLMPDGEGEVEPETLMANKAWYRYDEKSFKRTFFVLVREDQAPCYSETEVINTLGEPREKHQIGPYLINIYDPGNERIQSISFSSATVSGDYWPSFKTYNWMGHQVRITTDIQPMQLGITGQVRPAGLDPVEITIAKGKEVSRYEVGQQDTYIVDIPPYTSVVLKAGATFVPEEILHNGDTVPRSVGISLTPIFPADQKE